MGLFRLNPAIDALVGRILGETGGGGLVFFITRNGANVFRTWVTPENPQSPLQVAIRNYLAQSAVAYRELTAAQALIWSTTAAEITRTNSLGLSYELTGISLFCMINILRLMDAQVIVDDMPIIVKPIMPVGITSVILTTSVLLTIVADYTGNEDDYFGMINVSPPLPGEARQARPNDCRLLDPTIANNVVAVATNSVTFALAVTDSFYTVGDRIGIELTSWSDNYVPGDKTLIGNIAIAGP